MVTSKIKIIAKDEDGNYCLTRAPIQGHRNLPKTRSIPLSIIDLSK